MEWYWWLLILGALIMFCVVLAMYWWHKWHEMFLRGIYALTGFILGAVVMFILLMIFGKITW